MAGDIQLAELAARVDRIERQLRRLAEGPAPLDDGTVDRATAARMLGYTVSTMNRMATRGDGPEYFRRGRGRVYYRLKDVLAYQARHLRPIRRDRPAKNLPMPLFHDAG